MRMNTTISVRLFCFSMPFLCFLLKDVVAMTRQNKIHTQSSSLHTFQAARKLFATPVMFSHVIPQEMPKGQGLLLGELDILANYTTYTARNVGTYVP